MFDEDDFLPISALQHLAFCPRQCALIHIEGVWSENRLTAEGRVLHEKTHKAGAESRGDVRIARGLRLRSLRLGLTGIADVVEFHTVLGINGAPGIWRPFPVEYKRGRPKPGRCDTVQLCAQAICLEEMLGVEIETGAIFYGQPRRRLDVSLDAALRDETERLAQRLHVFLSHGKTPPMEYEKKCDSCSLFDFCLPRACSSKRSAASYLSAIIRPNPAEPGGV